MLRRSLLISMVFVIAMCPAVAIAQKETKDHPLVSRFQGSDVLEYKLAEFDEFPLALGPIDRITAAAREIGAPTLGRRLRLRGPNDEVRRLAQAFDVLVAARATQGLFGALLGSTAGTRLFLSSRILCSATSMRWPLGAASADLAMFEAAWQKPSWACSVEKPL